MGLLDVLFGKKGKGTTPSQPAVFTETMMTSQLPALYLQEKQTVYRDNYVRRLESIGFKRQDAEKMFYFYLKKDVYNSMEYCKA